MKIKVYVNDKDRTKPRKLVTAEKLDETKTTVIVKLPDGNVISRKKKRDLPEEEPKEKK